MPTSRCFPVVCPEQYTVFSESVSGIVAIVTVAVIALVTIRVVVVDVVINSIIIFVVIGDPHC